jgi:hypothetical protein
VLQLGVRDRIIYCLYVYLLYFLCATRLLFLVQLFNSCTAVGVAQRVCVYEWTIILLQAS